LTFYLASAHRTVWLSRCIRELIIMASSMHCQQKVCPHDVETGLTISSMQMGQLNSIGFYSTFIRLPQYFDASTLISQILFIRDWTYWSISEAYLFPFSFFLTCCKANVLASSGLFAKVGKVKILWSLSSFWWWWWNWKWLFSLNIMDLTCWWQGYSLSTW